jgi:threonyl-tRNA synthetase
VAYCEGVASRLRDAGFRVWIDARTEKTGYKIREAQLQKVPYMLLVGDREQENATVSLRTRTGGDKGAMGLEAFLEMASQNVRTRTLNLD